MFEIVTEDGGRTMTVEQYKAVVEAYRSGDINADTKLVFDNDGGYWDVPNDEDRNKSELLDSAYGTPDGYDDLVKLAIAAGINAEWV